MQCDSFGRLWEQLRSDYRSNLVEGIPRQGRNINVTAETSDSRSNLGEGIPGARQEHQCEEGSELMGQGLGFELLPTFHTLFVINNEVPSSSSCLLGPMFVGVTRKTQNT